MDQLVDIPDTDYFIMGDGRLLAAIQWSRDTESTPLGLLLGAPERMVRKSASLTLHPELGLRRTMLTVTFNGVRYVPHHDSTTTCWLDDGSVEGRWSAGAAQVVERFAMTEHGVLLRTVEVYSNISGPIAIEAALYANPLFLRDFTAAEGRLTAGAGHQLTLDSTPQGNVFERFLTVEPIRVAEVARATFRYAYDQEELSHLTSGTPQLDPPRQADEPSGSKDAIGPASERSVRVLRQYEISCRSIRAVVAHGGAFPASLWQYEFEWGMDAAMLARAAAMSGQHELSHEILLNALTRLSDSSGAVAEAGRFRHGELAELNGNGALLDALWHHWRFSGDDSLMREWWQRICAIAEYPLREEFSSPNGLLRGWRDFWERMPWNGVEEGYELGHQVFCAVGLRRAAAMAAALGDKEHRQRWADASDRIAAGVVDPTSGFVEAGRFWHRRRIDRGMQKTMPADVEWTAGDYAPYAPAARAPVRRDRLCDPDVTSVLPILYDLIDPKSELAANTTEALEQLWSPTGRGGYARYPLESDPDSPGPWPFATAFAAAAQIEVGFGERARRSIDWLLSAAGSGGSWLEYYGERRPPAPPVGIVAWAWAQYIILVVRHLAGVRIMDDHVNVRPRMAGLHLTVRIGRHRLDIAVEGLGAARLNGAPCGQGDCLVLPLPLTGDQSLDFESA